MRLLSPRYCTNMYRTNFIYNISYVLIAVIVKQKTAEGLFFCEQARGIEVVEDNFFLIRNLPGINIILQYFFHNYLLSSL